MTQHTPGPWAYNGPPHNMHVVQAAEPHMRVCFLTSDGPTVANARLIAAAPDLLATLRGTIGILEYGVGTRGWNIEADRIAAKVRAAIAKATGADEA